MSLGPEVEWLTPEVARRILAFQRARDETLGAGFFAEPAWQIVLICRGYDETGSGLDREEFAKHVNCGTETLRRWLALLVEHEVLGATSDGARYHLTDKALTQLARLRY